ncbi:pds [Symbiodinium sp. CCMP2592]|nr:pds [Symbiodinium sp. CCMP2592]
MQITAPGPASEAGFYRSATPFLLGAPPAPKPRWEGRHFASSVSAGLAATWHVARRVRLCAASPTRTVNPGTGEWTVPKDFAKPANIENTANYKEAKALSAKFVQISSQVKQKTVAVIGGGLSGLACAKYLSDAGHRAIVLEARDVLGGKVSAWQDEDGDWVETGLHIFFGAYPNMMNLFSELGIEDRLQWKRHQMTFAMQEFPGEFTTFEFPGWPAPLNMAAAILGNQKMLSPLEKLQTGPPLLPMLVEGQSFIDAQDECSVTEFCRKYGMPDRIIQEIFIPMAKALDFIDPDRLSMTVVLTAMNRFINETDGSQTAFLDGNQPDRLCQPMVEHIKRLGGDVRLGAVVEEVVLRPDGSVDYLSMRGGEKFSADEYVSAMPVDVLKRLLPRQWSILPFFRQLDQLEGIPVINIHLWFDRKLRNIDALCFSRSPLLSVYADMSTCCKEYEDAERSMLELVFAPCGAIAGSNINWIEKTDKEIVAATMKELERLFPDEIGVSLVGGGAQLRKATVVKVPRSVYAAIPGRNKFRPSQATPVPNFTLAGDWTSQKFLGSMEGAVLAGKLAAEVICDRARGIKAPIKAVLPSVERAASGPPLQPEGITGSTPIAFGGGAVMSEEHLRDLRQQDPGALSQ